MTVKPSPLAALGLVSLACAAAFPFGHAGAGEEANPAPAPVQKAAAKVEYNRDVRPILSENCFACHGPDSAARKADLRLDRREDAISAGAITPGDPAKSSLVERVCSVEPGEVMPPPKSLKKLTAAQVDTLKRWVAAGAEYQPHWSFIPPARAAVPSFNGDPAAKAWVRNPVDAFVYAKLKAAGLQPAPEADRRTLARRLALDLTGLPPDPADVEAFVADAAPDYYEKYVDKLLASPAWGEHRGRYWLDAARYGDTHGIHIDNYREIWAYRDWVIRAFNANQPFDQFTTEQLAGDLLPNPTLDQLVATGFNRCNITTSEGGSIAEEYLVLYTRDRTETVSQVWMGLTTGCAVCHDHKFDPVSAKDFYSLAAFFNNTTQAAMDGNVRNTPPVIPVPRAEDRARFAQLQADIAAAKAKTAARKAAAKADFAAWLKATKPEAFAARVPAKGLAFHAPLDEGKGTTAAATVGGDARELAFKGGYDWSVVRRGKQKAFTIKPADGAALALPGVGDFDRTQPFAVAAWVNVSRRNQTGALLGRMDDANNYRGWDVWLQNDRVGIHLISAYPQDAAKVVARAPLPRNKWVHVAVTHDGTGKAAGLKVYYDGEPQPVEVEADALKSTTRTAVPLKIGQRNTSSRVAGVALADLRVYDRLLAPLDVQNLVGLQRGVELLAKPDGKRTAAETEELYAWWLTAEDAEYQAGLAAQRALQEEEAAIRGRGTIAHIAVEKPTPPEAYVLFRGDYDKRREKVGPDTPAAVAAFPADLPRNRLGFAKWLLRPDHPLTARVTVNRFWQEVFGTGLVRTSGDFGITGDLPSHPELLDWLAVEFREGGWDVKRFFKLLVTSAAYRQAAVTTPEKLEKDRDNRLLSRGPRFRMDGEMVRDYALAASGLLVRKIGGPSVRPYQPDGVWEAVAMKESDTRNYRRDSGDNLYRRSLYTFWKRSAPPAGLEIFNAPSRETCTVRRDRTNTPVQALATLNDVQFVEAARVLAAKALADGGPTLAARLDFIARRLLARSLQSDELRVVEPVHADLLAHYAARPDDAKKLIAYGDSKAGANLDPAELAALTMVVNQLMNLDEVLNK